MKSNQESLPGTLARRWLARVVSARAMESIFDPFFADLQADFLEAREHRGAQYANRCLIQAYLSLAVQVGVFSIGRLFGTSYALAPVGNAAASTVAASFESRRGARYLAPPILGAAITLGLFLLMSSLISTQPQDPPEKISTPIPLIRAIPEPAPPAEPEPRLPKRPEDAKKPEVVGTPVQVTRPRGRATPTGPNEGWIGSFSPAIFNPGGREQGADREPAPIVRVEPVYPPRALTRGIEGWVDVEFTVNEVGRVSESRVLRSHPSPIFDGAALRAVQSWKYEPKLVDGEPVTRSGMRTRLRFQVAGGTGRSD